MVAPSPVADQETNGITVPSPYRGLYPFGPNDAELFFGRDVVIQNLMDRVDRQSFIAVLGSSGSGKSSVVLAGLVPALDQISRWKFVYFRPGDDPIYALAAALMPLYSPELDEPNQISEAQALSDHLRDGTVSFSDVLTKIRINFPQHQTLLIADQFEELFSLNPNLADRLKILDFVSQVAQPELLSNRYKRRDVTVSPLVLVLTMRADFMGQALNHRAFADLLQEGDLKLGPLSRAELEEVMVKPLKQSGVSFEPGLVERILDDVEHRPDSLPLLESALDLLWNSQADGLLSQAAYDSVGRVDQLLSIYADRVFNNLSESGRLQARHIFSLLVRPGDGTEDVCRRAARAEVGEDNWPLVKRLADARLVVTGRTEVDQDKVEVIHEALIRGWKRLQGWLSAERNFQTWLKGLRSALEQWQASHQAKGVLLRDTVLTEAEAWLNAREPDLEPAERDFIQASVAQREEEKRLQLAFELVTEGTVERDLSGADLHGANLSGADLSKVDLPGTNLSKTDLFGANLSGTNLRQATLAGAILIKAQLRETDLSSADLSEAKLNGANLTGANLSGANLSQANLGKADLSQANLSGAKLDGTNLSEARLAGVIMDDSTLVDDKWRLVWEVVTQGAAGRVLRGLDLSLADLSEVDLSAADLSGAGLTGTNLTKANLSAANLSGALMSLAKLREVDLRRANLSGANLSKADLSTADLSGVDLSEADLSEADLSEADLSGADLSEANLNQARLPEATLNGVNLNGAKLSEVDLSGAGLVETDLSAADLNEADLSGANLRESNLRGADLSGARLSGADLRWVDLRGTKLDDATKIDDKWQLVWKIVNQGGAERDLSGFDLIGVDLRGADLRKAKLDKANLSGANLSETDLSGANLSGANLSETDLRGASLIETNLSQADLEGAILNQADLFWANLSEAKIDATTQIDDKWHLVWEIINRGGRRLDLRQTDLSGADLRGIDFRWARLDEANLSGANLSETDLRGANLGASDLRWADLRGVKLDITTRLDHKWHLVWEIVNQGAADRRLSGSDLRGADLRGSDLRWAKLDQANLSGTDLRAANLNGADLHESNLQWADLRGAKINETTQIAEKWRRVWNIVNHGARGQDLRRADLSGADLNEADLSGADLSGADMSGDDLREADLSGANLSGTNLTKANLEAVIVAGARYSIHTLWPDDFDPVKGGAILVKG